MQATLKRAQLDWARSVGLSPDTVGYLADPLTNLPWLTAATRASFEAADGAEFGAHGGRAKIAAVHSSSALAVNVFDYWRGRDLRPLAAALRLTFSIRAIRFEQKFRTGVGSRSPNIDVVMTGAHGEVLGIESKFCEPFAHKVQLIQDKYFPSPPGLWHDSGLPGAQKAAESLRRHNSYQYIDAPQLMKHMLGLSKRGVEWRLLLLWFVPDEARAAMEAEARTFSRLLGSDSDRFDFLSYQELWHRLAPGLTECHAEYAAYMEQRYFPRTVV